MIMMNNMLQHLPKSQEEIFENILKGKTFRLERIISTGQTTPPGEWYDQAWDEWVMLLCGAAQLRFAQESVARHLQSGDAVFIPAHCRHRVEWTSPEQASVWLALHVKPDEIE